MTAIIDIFAREILDSRGNPTVEVDVELESGAFGRAAVPSGASTGSREALELRDGDKSRYLGKGVLKAVENVNTIIADELVGYDAECQAEIDDKLVEIDGSVFKKKLGANATLAVSLAVAKAAAENAGLPLYRYVGGTNTRKLPVPVMNVLNGGAHADNPLDLQEFMIAPIGAPTFAEALRMGAEIFHNLRSILKKAGHNTAVGDEGGFAPQVKSAEEALEFITRAIEAAGYTPGKDVMLAMDAAASELWKYGKYEFAGLGKALSSAEMIKMYEKLVADFPIYSIEDGMGEQDPEGWEVLTKTLGDKIQIVADDLAVTNPEIIAEIIAAKRANSILIKPNQIGTLTETLEAADMAHRAGFTSFFSHRSGETEDAALADLAVAAGSVQIKTGSASRSERMAKYNQLMRIEEELGPASRYVGTDLLKKKFHKLVD